MKTYFKITSLAILATIGFFSCDNEELTNQISENKTLIDNLKLQVTQAQNKIDSLNTNLDDKPNYDFVYYQLEEIKKQLNKETSDTSTIDTEKIQNQLNEIYKALTTIDPKWEFLTMPDYDVKMEELLGSWLKVERFSDTENEWTEMTKIDFSANEVKVLALTQMENLSDEQVQEKLKTELNDEYVMTGKYEIFGAWIEILLPIMEIDSDTLYLQGNSMTLVKKENSPEGLAGEWFRYNKQNNQISDNFKIILTETENGGTFKIVNSQVNSEGEEMPFKKEENTLWWIFEKTNFKNLHLDGYKKIK